MLDTLPKKLQGEGRALLTKIPYAETREEAERQKAGFQAWATKNGGPAAGRRLAEDWERLVTFYAFPKETPADEQRGRVAVRGGPVTGGRGQAVQEGRERDGRHREDVARRRASFRRLNAPELLPEVAEGVAYINGERAKRSNEKAAA